jgi:hypothetical protein
MQRALFILPLLCAVLIGCSGAAPTETLTEIKITGRGADANGEFCSDFTLNEAQARQFFERAKVVDASQLHDQFDLLPCYVQGTGKLQGAAAEWTVRAGGTAEVSSASRLLLMGCDTCDELLGGAQ